MYICIYVPGTLLSAKKYGQPEAKPTPGLHCVFLHTKFACLSTYVPLSWITLKGWVFSTRKRCASSNATIMDQNRA